MLLPLFILAIGMLFYRLAKKHRKPAWGYAFLGIGVFLATPLVVGMILWLILSAMGETREIEFVIALWSILASAIAVVVLHILLKRAWTKKPQKKSSAELLDN